MTGAFQHVPTRHDIQLSFRSKFSIITHARCIAGQCFKVDHSSVSGTGNFDLSQCQNPLRRQLLYTEQRLIYLPTSKILSRSITDFDAQNFPRSLSTAGSKGCGQTLNLVRRWIVEITSQRELNWSLRGCDQGYASDPLFKMWDPSYLSNLGAD